MKYKVTVDWSPKPIEGLNGSGYTNFSTKWMRYSGGLDVIYSAIEKLRGKHDEHMKVYGEDNDKRCLDYTKLLNMINLVLIICNL